MFKKSSTFAAMITQDQLKDVLERADALHRYLEIDKKKMEYEEEDLRTQAPDFWEDRIRAEEQMKKVKGIRSGLTDIRRYVPWPTNCNWLLTSIKMRW